MRGLDVAVAKGDGSEAVFFENPARPTFVNAWFPRTVQSHARFFGGDGFWRSFRGALNDERILVGDFGELVVSDSGDNDCTGVPRCRGFRREADLAACR